MYAPKMIINKINSTKTIADDETQFPIFFPPFYWYSHYCMALIENM